MCGVAGIFHYREPGRPVDRAVLAEMSRRLSHRGPDDAGVHVDGPLGFAHRRLSIVELTQAGHQPMCTPDGGAWICYNGEIYNHRDFRPALESRGVAFRGHADTETLLHLVRERGPGALAELAGIFAFAYWDAARGELLLARDPLGVKQLYFYDDGRSIYFASEIKALLAVPGMPREPDPEGVNEYLHFHTTLFDRTFLRHVRQLRAGQYLTVGAAGLRPTTYWEVDDFSVRQEPAERQLEELRDTLGSVVREQLMGDVPAGAFFSGGIDSTAIAAFAVRAGHRPTCFGVHFTGQGVIDERPFQEEAARALGLDLRLITLDGSTFPDDLLRLIHQQDQPVLGAAMFPMDRVSRLAAGEVKLCLGGQGADEVFAGYARHALVEPLRGAKALLARSGAPAGMPSGAPAGAPAAGGGRGNLWKQLTDRRTLRRLASSVSGALDWRARYLRQFARVGEGAWRQLFAAPEFVSRDNARTTFRDTLRRSGARTPLQQALHWEVQTYLTGLFHQDDRLSMGWSLESRVPMADPRVVRFGFRTPSGLKIRDGASKWLLRRSLDGVIPEWVITRRKVGFDTPAEQWMRGPHAGFVRELLLSDRARQRGFWRPEGIEALLATPDAPHWFDLTWKLVCIEAWARLVLDGDAPPAAPAR